ncbi:MAG TPA: VCBS repeat-containing protein [Myxococcales bacterium]|nr:VCBS repeat-containing protein [Myxococcales bacterium]
MLLAPLMLAAAAAAPRFQVQELVVEGEVASVVASDLDGDGRKDLVVVYKTGLPPYQKRSFAVFWNRAGVFAPRPDWTQAVDEAEACAYDVGVVGPGPAEDLLLVTPRGVNARSFAGRVASASRRLVDRPTLFHQPINGELPRVRLVRDLAGPNSHDLLVPSLGALAIFRRNGTGYEKAIELEVDMDVSGGSRRNEALEVRYGFPVLHILDADGDGLRDVFAIQEDRVAIYRQGPGFTFHPQPDFSRDFSVRTPADHRERGTQVTTLVADLDGDGFADLIIRKQVFEGVTSARSTNYVFFGRKEGFSREPAQVLESEGVTLFQTQLVDLNADGHPDLVVPYTSFGVFAIIRMLTAKTARVDFQIFPFDPKARRFASEPVSDRDLKFRIPLSGEADLQAVNLAADVTGDGKPDLIFGSGEEQLDIYPWQGPGEFASSPAETVEVRSAGVLEAVDLDGKGRVDLILNYPKTRGHRGEIVVLTNRGGW